MSPDQPSVCRALEPVMALCLGIPSKGPLCLLHISVYSAWHAQFCLETFIKRLQSKELIVTDS